jgi:NADH-quinone oxidoreductase subunit F
VTAAEADGRGVTLTPALTAHWDEPDSFTLEGYLRDGGYQALPKALAMPPDQVIQTVKDSVLRGRGGAGFPTGVKWGFLPQGDGKPHYLVVNADESEPGACKDMPTMLNNPQALIEGTVIASYAIQAQVAFIYVRGEVLHVIRRLHHAVAEAREAGFVGRNILGSGFDLDIVVHAGAGAYICGEETALLTSLEGFRGLPRLKPPFPATSGLYASPTDVNNVESIASAPWILQHGARDFAAIGTEKSKGFGIFQLSGHVTTPGQYEAPLGTTLRQLLDLAGGIRGGHQLKFWTPGGSSTALLTDQYLDVPMDYESMAAAGSSLGTRSVQLFDETTCVVRVVLGWARFYKHESCGKCTPCREGSYWVVDLLDRLERGEGNEADLEKLLDICSNITGRAFCPLGDSIEPSVKSSITFFRDEYVEHLRHGGCPFDPAASTLFTMESAR